MRPEERYQVKGKLGEGGMGSVFRAFDGGLMRDVAIKVIRRDALMDQDARARFDQEAKAAGMLNHSNIVTIYDRAEQDGQPYIVMEFVEGQTLDQYVKTAQPAPPKILSILRQVAAALDYAHARQVVHRDIKPSNIMVQPDGVAKVMDFGIAKAEAGAAGLTSTGMMVGSPHYVPPERYSSGLVSGATDQWALAITAYEAFTGRRPFHAESWDTLTYQIVNAPAPDPTEFQPNMPKRASAALLKALAKKPEDRFPTCTAFVEALAAGFVTDSSASTLKSTPPPPKPVAVAPEPANKTNPILFGAIAVAVLLVGGIVWFVTRPGNGKVDEHKQPDPPKKDPVIAAVINTPTGEMVLVPAGTARIGKDATPTPVEKAFYIDKTEVPVSAYRQFVQATGRAAPPGLESAAPDTPIVNITWEDAEAFAAWAQKRLPTAIEWEKAARGSDGRALPWAGAADADKANVPVDRAGSAGGRLAAVTAFPAGASPYGALNMVGNAWEWTGTSAHAPPPAQLEQYRRTFRELNPPVSETEAYYQVRGGSFRFDMPLADWPSLVWDSGPVPARARRPDIGFRCVRDLP